MPSTFDSSSFVLRTLLAVSFKRSADLERAVIAKKPLDLADDHRNRIGGELDFVGQIKFINRFKQANTTDLKQILRFVAASHKPLHDRPDEPNIALNKRVARNRIAGLTKRDQPLYFGIVQIMVAPFVSYRLPCGPTPMRLIEIALFSIRCASSWRWHVPLPGSLDTSKSIHEVFHDRKAHAGTFHLRLGRIKRLAGQIQILNAIPVVLDDQLHNIALNDRFNGHLAAWITVIAMDNGIRYGFGNAVFRSFSSSIVGSS